MTLSCRSFGLLFRFHRPDRHSSPESDGAKRGRNADRICVETPVLTQIERNGPEQVGCKILEWLVDHDADLNPIPALATSWKINADWTPHTFHLRAGVT